MTVAEGRAQMNRHAIWGGRGLATIVAIGAAPAGWSSKPTSEKTAALTPPFLETRVAPRPASDSGLTAKGKAVFDANCVQCHGASGQGDGFGAPFLVPPPRDFTAGQFKFRTTSSGQLPTDDDLFRTISRGANGTGMPPWQYSSEDEDRWALVDYVKTFDARFASAANAPTPMPLPDSPDRKSVV